MPTLLDAARRLAPHRIHLFALHAGHFLDPLVSEHWRRLRGDETASAPATLRVAHEILPSRLDSLKAGIYFPVPIGRDLEAGGDLEALLGRYHYDFVEVDEDGTWWWRGSRVAERTRRFFLEHLSYEAEVERYAFEYRVHDGWWDRGYLDCRTPPLVARRLTLDDGALRVELENDRSDGVDPSSFRFDVRERLLCRTHRFGEVALSDWLRFSLLRGMSEDGSHLSLAGENGEERSVVPLSWPPEASGAAEPAEP